ncbi:hypothetical protein IMG5_075270, partial [Ichthyophthirius multifiliis]
MDDDFFISNTPKIIFNKQTNDIQIVEDEEEEDEEQNHDYEDIDNGSLKFIKD